LIYSWTAYNFFPLHVERQNADFFSTLPKIIFSPHSISLSLKRWEKAVRDSKIKNQSDQHNAAAGNPYGMISESKHRKVSELFPDLRRES
jgi:hypothetical protein